jgi:hypothetical protein
MASISPAVVTKNADGNSAIRIVRTNPSPADAQGPVDIILSNNQVLSGSGAGTKIGTLVSDGGTSPFTWSIPSGGDPDSKFQIPVGTNELQLSSTVDYITAQFHNVTIRVTDNNGKTFDKVYIIEVVETAAAGYQNFRSAQFNGTNAYLATLNTNNIGGWGSTGFSWQIWFKSDVTGTVMTFLDSLETSNGVRIQKLGAASSDRLNVIVRKNSRSKDFEYDFASYLDDRWHQIVITYQNNDLGVFFDGVLTAPTVTNSNQIFGDPLTSSISSMLIGAQGAGAPANFFNGRMDLICKYNTKLSQVDVGALYNNGRSADPETVQNSNLNNFYNFEDPENLASITDTKGNDTFTSFNVIEEDFKLDTPNTELTDQSIELDGLTQNIIADNYQPDLSNPWTFSIWLKRLSISNSAIWSNANGFTSQGIAVYMDTNGSQRINVRINGTGAMNIRYTLGAGTLNNWNHLVITSDGGTDESSYILYLNGARDDAGFSRLVQGNSLTAYPADQTEMHIGANFDGSNKIEARLTQYVVYDKELTASEVFELYNDGAGVNPASLDTYANAQVHYELVRSGSTVTSFSDLTLNGRDGFGQNINPATDYVLDVP